MTKKTKMLSLTIKELSGVDRPAQVGAKALIMKRDSARPTVKKIEDMSPEDIADMVKRGAAVLTTATDGHTHLVMLEDFDGNKVVSGTTTWQDEHTHPWIMLEDGTILIGEVDDHDHEPDKESKLAGDTTMTPEEKAALEKAEQDAKDNKALAKRFEAIAKFNDATKAYFETLDKAGQDAFLTKSADDQATDVTAFGKAQADDNPVVYKAENGDQYRKNDDPRLVQMAKDRDADRKELSEQRAVNKRQDLEKRAAELLPNLPGTIQVRASMLEKVESISDETERQAAIDALKASNDALDPAFKSIGTGGSPTIVEGSAESQLEKMAEDYAKEHKVSHAVAYSKVLETSKGAELYQKHKDSSQGATH